MAPFTTYLARSIVALVAALSHFGAAYAADADETELRRYFNKVEPYHFHAQYSVGYNDQDVVTTRELAAKPPATGKLCYIRFDLVKGEGDYAFGFRPNTEPSTQSPVVWGVFVHKRGDVVNQLRSTLSLNVIYFYVDEPREEFADEAATVCEKKQAAKTASAGAAYGDHPWSDLIVRALLKPGLPQQSSAAQ